MIGMDAFFTDAEHLLEVARAAADEYPAETLVLRHRDGSVRISNASGLPNSAVWDSSGAAAVYRITRDSGCVRVEGKSGLRSCLLEARQPSSSLPGSATHLEDRLRECSLRQSVMRGWPEYGAPGRYPGGNRGSGVGPCLLRA